MHWRLLPEGLLWRDLDGELVVFCRRSGATHRLIDAEAWLFERLTTGPATTEQLVVEIREHASAESAAFADETVGGMLELFERNGLVGRDVAASGSMSGPPSRS